MWRMCALSRLTGLVAVLCFLAFAQARADLVVTLTGVTFADGGTAAGSFTLNTYGYIEAADIVTTPGTSIGNVSLPGFTYSGAGAAVSNGPVFDTDFFFNSTATAFSLALEAQQPLTAGFSGADALVLGTDNFSQPTGSTETCQQNPSVCDGASYLDGRVVTAGGLFFPEPSALSLLGAGVMGPPLLRRR